MRQVPDILTARWHSGVYVGDARPVGRVTLQVPRIRLHRTDRNLFSTLMFGRGKTPRELPNVKSISWNRSTDADVAEAEIVFYNTDPLPVGAVVTTDLDRPGYYTYNYGGTSYSSRWGHKPNAWSGLLMPDNVLRTFEGYGCNPNVIPEADPNLVQTGMWLIDDVTYSSDGTIVVKARDVGRILLDQIAFPPVVPFKAGFVSKELPDGAYSYPVTFASVNSEPTINKVPVPAKTSRLSMTYRTSSNAPWTGDNPVYGHRPRHAFNDDDASYWLSIGNARPDQGYSFEWIEGAVKKQTVRRVRFKSLYRHTTAYLSVFQEGKGWLGGRKIPYNPNHPASAPNGADIPYVATVPVTGTGWTEFLGIQGGYGKNITRVRVTFAGLHNSGLGTYPYRAGMRRFEAYGGADATTKTVVTTYRDKNYDDYTDIVKLLCAWGGFYWPRPITYQVGEASLDRTFVVSATKIRERLVAIRNNRGLPADPAEDTKWVNYILSIPSSNITGRVQRLAEARNAYDLLAGRSPGAEEVLTGGASRFWRYGSDDNAMTIQVGRLWGDFKQSGTAGPDPIPASVFDKKPLMDGIAFVRDIIGFIFYIDEYGSVVFKPPNIYSVGNTWRTIGTTAGARTTQMVTLDERQTLISMTADLTSRHIRERTFVSNGSGNVGHMAAGWNPNPIGLRRVNGWTDQHFATSLEARVMAEMLALRQLFSYRTDKATIPGNPAIQIDDQVRIFERTTSEGFIHYVSGISSTLDHETGEYIYELDTHWLGERPFKKWAFDPAKLSAETQQYLKGLYS